MKPQLSDGIPIPPFNDGCKICGFYPCIHGDPTIQGPETNPPADETKAAAARPASKTQAAAQGPGKNPRRRMPTTRKRLKQQGPEPKNP